MRKRAGIARRAGTPVLDFFFLIYQEGGSWLGRSIRTGHVSESRTAAGAVRNLMLAIAAEIGMATSDGLSVQEWYESQEPDDGKYVAMFFDAIARRNPHRQEAPAHRGGILLRAVVAKAAA